MTTLNTATINYGGINNSKLEYVDYSTSSLQHYFMNTLETFENLKNPHSNSNINVYNFIVNSLGEHVNTEQKQYLSYMLSNASKFITNCMSQEFILSLDSSISNTLNSSFNLRNIPLSKLISNILIKDKGLGGFDKIGSGRMTKIGNIQKYMKLVKGSETVFDNDNYMKDIVSTYLSGKYEAISLTKLQSETDYSDIYMKGRREGINGGTKNYYKNFENSNSVSNGNIPTTERTTLLCCLGNLLLMVHDLISAKIATCSAIPSELLQKPEFSEQIAQKSEIVKKLIETRNLDVLFVNECVPMVFDNLPPNYNVEYGIEKNDVCNTIIYKINANGVINEPFVVKEVTTEIYPKNKEYAEIPLHLQSRDGLLNLVCYHAGGKGVTIDGTFGETSLVNWIYTLSETGLVIMGADLNIDYKSNAVDIDKWINVGTLDKNTYSSYKQRSPLQAQYDKIGKFDTKLKDYIITSRHGIERTTSHVLTFQPETGTFTDVLWNAPKQSLIIPNSNYYFDHYIITETLNVSSINEKRNSNRKYNNKTSRCFTFGLFSMCSKPKRNNVQDNNTFKR